MGWEYTVEVSGVPRPHQRPTLAGGRWVHRQDRPEDLNWRATVRAAWLTQVGNLGLAASIEMSMDFWGGRGDIDNLLKSVLDSLGARGWTDGLAPLYRDDRQVVSLHVERFTARKHEAGALIRARRLGWPFESSSAPVWPCS